jgi:precorrin-6B methylase 2
MMLDKLLAMMNAQVLPQMILAAMKFNTFDLIAAGVNSVEEIASLSNGNSHILRRLFRALAAYDILTDQGNGKFDLTEIGAVLCSGRRSDGLKALPSYFELILRSWSGLDEVVRTGQPGVRSVAGMDWFQYLEQDSRLAQIFNLRMAEETSEVAKFLLQDCAFEQNELFVDVGGGVGGFVGEILLRHSSVRAVLFDTPTGISGADSYLTKFGVRNRCEIVAGDFFRAVPSGARTYVLKSILHDWDDERAVAILRCCRQAMNPGSRLVVIEPILPMRATSTQTDCLKFMSDLQMMALTGGRERTEDEIRSMLQEAGFGLIRVISASDPSIFSLTICAPV